MRAAFWFLLITWTINAALAVANTYMDAPEHRAAHLGDVFMSATFASLFAILLFGRREDRPCT